MRARRRTSPDLGEDDPDDPGREDDEPAEDAAVHIRNRG